MAMETVKGTGKMDVRKLVTIGLMAAISIVLGYFPEIPLAFFAPWLKLDFAFVPMLLTGFSLGLVPGCIVLLLQNAFRLLTSSSMMVGEVANVLVGASILVPSVLIYRAKHTQKGALLGMGVGVLLMVLASVLVNRYILLPLYFGDATKFLTENPTYLWAAAAPFNLVKGVAVSAVTFFLYKPLARFLKRGLRA